MTSDGTIEEGELRSRLREQVARFCPGWFRDQIDDIVQIAWLRLQSAREKDGRNRNPEAFFLSRVAYCATIDEIRRRQRRREVPLDGPAENLSTRAVERLTNISDLLEIW